MEPDEIQAPERKEQAEKKPTPQTRMEIKPQNSGIQTPPGGDPIRDVAV